jgi:hypothetical protein
MKTFKIGLKPAHYTDLYWFEIDAETENAAIEEAILAARKHFGHRNWSVYRSWEI